MNLPIVCIAYTHIHTHKYILLIITHTFPGFMLGPFIVLCFYSMCSFLIIYPFVFSSCKILLDFNFKYPGCYL